jgi:outer membrane protein TolC
MPLLTLDQAIRQALENSRPLRSSAIDVDIWKDKITEARSHLFPKVHFTGAGIQLLTPLNFRFNKGDFGTFPETGPIPAQNTNIDNSMKPLLFLNVSAIQPIFQLGRVNLARRQAQIGRLIAQEKVEVQREQLVNQMQRAYYKALELQDGLKVLEASATLYREIDRTTNEYLKLQAVLKADALDVKQQLASVEYETLKQRNALASQKEVINHLIGRDPQIDFDIASVGDLPDLSIDLASAQSRARQGRAQVKQAASESEQIDLERRAKKLQYAPDMSLIVDYFSVFGTQVLPHNIVFAGLLMNWEPWDWGRRHAEIGEQRKMLRQSNLNSQELDSQIMLEVNDSYRKLRESRQFLQVTQLGREVALEKMRVLTNKYKEQATLLRDVLQAQRDLTQANTQYNQSILALWSAKADFEKAIGEEH